MNNAIRFVVCLLIMSIFYVSYGFFDDTELPHWKLWSYNILAENGSENCSVKITPVFLNLFEVDFDSVEFNYSPALIDSLSLSESEFEYVITCGNNLYIESQSFIGGKEEYFDLIYKNSSYYTSKSIPSFLHSYHDVYFRCKEKTIKTNLKFTNIVRSDFALYCSGYKYLIHK